MTDKIALWAAIFSAVATGLAAFATWRAPLSAATLAESLRRDAERHDQLQKRKMRILTVLMQERARINSEDGVRALNSIDIVFADSREVREAWAELFHAFNMQPLVMHLVDERLRRLLAAVAKDVGIADQLRIDDLGRVYYPTSHQEEQQIKDMQRRSNLLSLMRKNAEGANSAFPPKP
jgi:hypothetical protein